MKLLIDTNIVLDALLTLPTAKAWGFLVRRTPLPIAVLHVLPKR